MHIQLSRAPGDHVLFNVHGLCVIVLESEEAAKLENSLNLLRTCPEYGGASLPIRNDVTVEFSGQDLQETNMGWWDEGIMSGDTPLDIWREMKEFLETPPDPGEKDWIFRSDELVTSEHLTGRLLELEQFMLRTWRDDAGYIMVGYEIIGFQAMVRGVEIPNELKKRIRKQIRAELSDLKNATWTRPERRREVLRNFLQALKQARPGVPIPQRDVGLIEKMSAGLEGSSSE